MRKSVLFLVMLICGTASADQYLCTGEKATGFRFDESTGKWVESKFIVSNNRYIIAPFGQGGYQYRVTEKGNDFALANCKNDFDKYGYLECSKLWIDFKFNRINGRYLKVNGIGYYNVVPEINQTTDETSHSPMIEIGTCSETKSEKD